jgi:hypothetical protein
VTDTERVAFTKTLRDGRTAIVTVAVNSIRMTYTTIRIDGKEAGSHVGPHHAAPKPALAKAGPEYVAAIGPLLLTADQCAQIEAVYNEVRAMVPPDWTARRELLASAIRGAEEDLHGYLADRFDSGDYPNPFAGAEKYEGRIEQAVAALAAFDAEHPEIAVQAAEYRSAAVQRALEGRD